MPRLNIPLSVTVQFDNPVQPPAYNAAAIMTQVTLATNDAGQAVAQPAHSQYPMVAEDVTDDLLAAMNAKLLSLGLEVIRRA
jgi:hypothetical protein